MIYPAASPPTIIDLASHIAQTHVATILYLWPWLPLIKLLTTSLSRNVRVHIVLRGGIYMSEKS